MAKKSSTVNNVVKKTTILPKTRKEAGKKNARPRAGVKPVSINNNEPAILKALYKIADAASAVKDMQSFYKKLHGIVGKIMYANNFFIATYDEQADLISWPYHVDEMDVDEESWGPQLLTEFKGSTGYVIRTGKTIHVTRDLQRIKGVEIVGASAKDGIAVPLMTGKKVLGALVVQSYASGIVYGEEDQVEALLETHPMMRNCLLHGTTKVVDYSRRAFKHLTAFQLALCALDNEMCDRLKAYMSEEEITEQYQAIFLTGYEAYAKTQQPFDFTRIVRAITDSRDADVKTALQLQQPNMTELWQTLEQFRRDFTRC